jgi:hypothetical protein
MRDKTESFVAGIMLMTLISGFLMGLMGNDYERELGKWETGQYVVVKEGRCNTVQENGKIIKALCDKE